MCYPVRTVQCGNGEDGGGEKGNPNDHSSLHSELARQIQCPELHLHWLLAECSIFTLRHLLKCQSILRFTILLS
jgi:hypothetical protein